MDGIKVLSWSAEEKTPEGRVLFWQELLKITSGHSKVPDTDVEVRFQVEDSDALCICWGLIEQRELSGQNAFVGLRTGHELYDFRLIYLKNLLVLTLRSHTEILGMVNDQYNQLAVTPRPRKKASRVPAEVQARK